MIQTIDKNDNEMDKIKLRFSKPKARVSAELAGIDVSVEQMIVRIDNNDKEMEK